MTLINTLNLEQARKLIREAKENPIIVEAQADEFNRKILEYGKFDILLNIESSERKKDKPKQLSSGLNHVLAKIAAKNNIAIGIDLDEIRYLEKKEKAQRLARIKQNIKICRKAKTKIVCLNVKDKIDAFNLLLSLGASTKQAKQSLLFQCNTSLPPYQRMQ